MIFPQLYSHNFCIKIVLLCLSMIIGILGHVTCLMAENCIETDCFMQCCNIEGLCPDLTASDPQYSDCVYQYSETVNIVPILVGSALGVIALGFIIFCIVKYIYKTRIDPGSDPSSDFNYSQQRGPQHPLTQEQKKQREERNLKFRQQYLQMKALLNRKEPEIKPKKQQIPVQPSWKPKLKPVNIKKINNEFDIDQQNKILIPQGMKNVATPPDVQYEADPKNEADLMNRQIHYSKPLIMLDATILSLDETQFSKQEKYIARRSYIKKIQAEQKELGLSQKNFRNDGEYDNPYVI